MVIATPLATIVVTHLSIVGVMASRNSGDTAGNLNSFFSKLTDPIGPRSTPFITNYFWNEDDPEGKLISNYYNVFIDVLIITNEYN